MGANNNPLSGLREARDAVFNTFGTWEVSRGQIEALKARAGANPRGHFRLCLHSTPDEPIQEMVVVSCRGSYSTPHKHPDRTSSFLVIEGEMLLVVFDEEGRPQKSTVLTASRHEGVSAVRLAPDVWHMTVPRSDTVVFYETIAGHNRDGAAKRVPPWAPGEDDQDGVENFLSMLSAI